MNRKINRRVRRSLAAFAVLTMVAAACSGDDDDSTADQDDTSTESGDSADSGDGGGGATEGGADCEPGETDGDLNLYNWSEYIDPALKKQFAKEFGVEVVEDNFDSNEAMQPIVSAGNSGYDVIVPSDYMVTILIDSGVIMPLDKDAIPNLENLAPEFASDLPYDPEGNYSVPYQWGTTGLGVDMTVTGQDVPHTWGLVFDPELSEQYHVAGSISMLNDPREALAAALYYLGYSPNTTNEDELNEAKDLLADARDRILAFDSDQYDQLLVSGEAALTQGYNGNFVVQFAEADAPDQYAYFVPEEGATQWVDNMAIVTDAPHPCTAHAFIDFILDAKNGAALSNWNSYASPNKAAEQFIDKAVLNDPTVYPPKTAKLEFLIDTGEFETNYSDAFSEAKG